ncbi:MAG: ABC transporter permease [Phycisphaerales bacterium]|nr:ABC transporter permease [Phycisphaerales bacterium]
MAYTAGRVHPILAPIAALGGSVTRGLSTFGDFWVFSAQTAMYSPLELGSPRSWRRMLQQAYAIGTRSAPVLMLTGAFVGMVLVVQGWEQFSTAGFADRLGAVVNMSVAAELGPVLAGVMLAGRVGGALTAELGTMNVTEQILALRTMGAEPIRFLATPRFLACLLLAPILTLYADLMGTIGSWIIYAFVYGGDSEPYWFFTRTTVEMWDVGVGMTKSMFFGGAIGLISCHMGFHTTGGAQGVGEACTRSFVISFIAILALDLVLNLVNNGVYKMLFGNRSLF